MKAMQVHARRFRRIAPMGLLAALAVSGIAATAPAQADGGHGKADFRIATFNASLNRSAAGQLIADLSTPNNAQAKTVAEIIQRVRPDIVLINEFDFDENGEALRMFRKSYLEVAQNGASPIKYKYSFSAPSNTGIPSAHDLDNNGSVGGPNDAYGFGFYPGQFGMAILSRFPISESMIRTFQNFLWKDMPGALLPDNPATPEPDDWYSSEELDAFRLSSKSHWDVPITVKGQTVHVLASHPTPPVFDDPPAFPAGVDFNGRRNHDENRFWADYVGLFGGHYIVDDKGRQGGLRGPQRFVILGDMNADPFDGDSVDQAAQQLLDHPAVDAEFAPTSQGAVEQAALQGGANASHEADPKFDTADFADTTPGNLRADYVLPSKRGLRIVGGAVFWPVSSDPLFALVGTFPFPSSDHRLVYLDLKLTDMDSGRH